MLPHFCATGACIHVMIIALYICQRNILIVSAFLDAMALCISSQDKCERTVACYIAGCSKAVLQCKNRQLKAVPVASKPSTLMIRPKEAITVPPGTPGAPIAKIPSNRQNKIIVPNSGKAPYKSAKQS